MPRKPREACESQIYHVVQRGVGQQVIFEDDEDRRFFLGLLQKYLCDEELPSLLAWCLMSNHTHLLIRKELPALSRAMKLIGVGYARHFNDRYGRTGHLFQDRFASEAIKDDRQLVTVIRYIHNNPAKANMANTSDYVWSSYQECIGTRDDGLIDRDSALAAFGNIDEFVRFHQACGEEDHHLDIREEHRSRPKLTESEALDVAEDVLGSSRVVSLKAEAKAARDDGIRMLREAGLSARQIMRLTGISLGAISRAFSGEQATGSRKERR